MKENSRLTMMLKGNCEAIASERKERILWELREAIIKKGGRRLGIHETI